MKVIDLLNKIANGEEVPYRIKYNNKIYEYTKEIDWYLREDLKSELFIDKIRLNDTVEILEEEKKIPEKEDELIGYNIQDFDNLKEFVEITTNDVFGKINKIINKQNKIINYLDYLKSKGE